MTRRILALYDSANAEQVGTLDKLRATGNRGDAGGAYRDMALLHGIWLCPVDVREDFPREAMDHETFRVWATSAFNTGRTDVWAHWAKTVYRHLFCPLWDKHTCRVVCL